MKNRITGRSAFLALLKDEGVTHRPAIPAPPNCRSCMGVEGSPRPHLCDGDAGKPGRRHGRWLQPRLRQARRLQCPRRAGARQRDRSALQREFYRHALDPDRGTAGAGTRPDGTGAVWSAGPDGGAAGEMGGRGDAAGRSAADLVRRAAKIATTPPTGPVFISLPGDILNAEAGIELGRATRVDTRVKPSDELLKSSRRRFSGGSTIVRSGAGTPTRSRSDRR